MSDIELVIKIPEEMYEQIKDGYVPLGISKYLMNGIPLPKGHGRIGDLSKIYVKLNEAQIEGAVEYKGLGKAKQIVSDAPTIIEADEESEE